MQSPAHSDDLLGTGLDLLCQLGERGTRLRERDHIVTFAASGGKFAPNPEMRALERGLKFPIALSCVDKNKPRHALQNALPQLLIGGSTDGLTAKASIFDLGAGTACLKCHNPLQSRNTVIEARRASLQMLEGEARLAYARELGLTEADAELLLSASGCGKLAEGDLLSFTECMTTDSTVARYLARSRNGESMHGQDRRGSP